MTVFTTVGTPRQFTDGTDTYYAPQDAVDSVTGGMGVTSIRIINNATVDLGLVEWTSGSTTYDFADVAYTTDSASGTGAVLDVSVTVDGYVVTIANGGTDFAVADNISVLGTEVGGSTTANDINITVDAVVDGTITSISVGGTAQWPQSYQGSVYVLPQSETFVLTQTGGSQGLYILGNVANASMYIQPVTIVG